MMNREGNFHLEEAVFEELKDLCKNVFTEKSEMNVSDLLIKMMDHPDVPMHYPYHHFIVPAALLTAAAVQSKTEAEDFLYMLDQVEERSKNILGGFCGYYGACGAGIGAGIFMSVFTDTTPMSGKTWQWANEITGKCLVALSQVPGPRCCKRTAFLSLEEAIPYINDKLELHLSMEENITCRYHDRNQQCKRKKCPYYKPDF